MGRIGLFATVVLVSAVACGHGGGTGGSNSTGGTTNTGGTAGAGGTANTGGTAGAGGTANTGGTAGSGGTANTGGMPQDGGGDVSTSHAPVLGAVADQDVIRNTLVPRAFSVNFTYSDPDGDPVTVNASSDAKSVLPDADLAAGLSCNAGSCTLSAAPSAAADATVNVTITASDGTGEVTTSSFAVHVGPRLVTTNADSGAGSLRELMTGGGGTVSGDVIGFASTTSSPVTLSTGIQFGASAPDVLTLEGPSNREMVITGTSSYGLFWLLKASLDYRISRLTFAGASMTGAGGGPAIAVGNGRLRVAQSIFRDNIGPSEGGAVRITGGDVGFTDCSFLRNRVAAPDDPGSGAAAISLRAGQLGIDGCTFANNNADGARGIGGAIWVSGGNADILDSTFVGNKAAIGGALSIRYNATASIIQSTITMNAASDANFGGGGLDASGNAGAATLSLRGTIVAGNSAAVGPDIKGIVSSGGYNLLGTASGVTFQGSTTGNIVSTSAGLGSLSDNGGFTSTVPLVTGSPALDRIPLAACTDLAGKALTVDQRNLPRQTATTGLCDIGAFER